MRDVLRENIRQVLAATEVYVLEQLAEREVLRGRIRHSARVKVHALELGALCKARLC